MANKGNISLDDHIKITKHKQAIRGETSSSKMTDYFCKPGTKSEDEVAAAEATMAFHTVKHHYSYKSNDCTSTLMAKIFPDSSTAKKFSCARTKIGATVNNVLAPASVQCVLNDIEKHEIMYLGVFTDGSNHKSTKLFPIVIQYFDWKNGGMQSKLLDVRSLKDETSLTIANEVKETLKKRRLFDKCISFTGDNCNTNFGGIHRKRGNNVFTHLKSEVSALVGVDCPAHILNNCLHHGVNQMSLNLESIIYKTYQHFSIYTVRTEQLKDYCVFVEIEYKKLLSHSVTRWLSLYPSLSRMIHMYPAIQSYFLSIDKPPVLLKHFFENSLSKLYLKHLQSFVDVFHKHVQNIEQSKISLVEVVANLDSVKTIILQRKRQMFVSVQVKSKLAKLREEGKEQECNLFMSDVSSLYDSCVAYLDEWTTSFAEFKCFDWMLLSEIKEWDNVERCVRYLAKKNVDVDDAKLFDQYQNLCKFVLSRLETDEVAFSEMKAHEKWTEYFKHCRTIEFYSELLKIAQFFFCIMAHNANVERIFSMMQTQWCKERDSLLAESVCNILKVMYNSNHISCKQFYDDVKADPSLLKKVKGTAKYSCAQSD